MHRQKLIEYNDSSDQCFSLKPKHTNTKLLQPGNQLISHFLRNFSSALIARRGIILSWIEKVSCDQYFFN